MAGTPIRSLVLDARSNYSGGFGNGSEGYPTTQGGIRKVELFLNGELLGTTDGSDFDVYTSAGDAFAPFSSATKVPWKENPKIDTAGNNNYLSSSGMFSSINDASPQRVIIVFYDIYFADKIVINNYHYSGDYTARGFKGLILTSTIQELVQADVDDILQPVPGGVELFNGTLPEHFHWEPNPALGNIADDFEIDTSLPDYATLSMGLGLGFLTGGGSDINEARLRGGFDVNMEFKADQALPNSIACGLSLAAGMTAAAERKPAVLLAALGLSMTGEITQPAAATLKGKLCLSCLLRANSIPDNALKAAFALRVKMTGASEQKGTLNVGLTLGSKLTAQAGTPPCLAAEFNRGDWF